ncbi:pyridoxamine 5'-phosphate oxidase family protein [Nocardia sp. NPDC005745]|uniref:pyridoxamine 5'-phosphate oxidase family protein n=1 Tax=Nocardia sp. NPDC005745 TaxID=3157061 RepID=UPI0033F6B9A0
MSRRDQIRMSNGEIDAYLAAERIMTCATLASNGRPHLVPLWYAPDTPTRLDCWTYASSQKVHNLRSRPQATVQVESGDGYERLRGVSMECDVELVDDADIVAGIGLAVTARYSAELTADSVGDDLTQFVRKQAAKRVGLRFHPTRIVSWDHRKLGGVF